VFDANGKIRLAMKHAQTAQECAADLRLLLNPKKETNFLKGLFQ
jgi:protein SCO1/2